MSRASDIWWERLGASLRLRTSINSAMREGESLTVCFPAGIPWSEYLYRYITDLATTIDANRGLRLIDDDPASEVGDEVLIKLCGRAVAESYWPGTDYGEYLCKNRGYAVHTFIVWVKNIGASARLREWQKFISRYDAAAKKQGYENKAQFLLEYSGPARGVTGRSIEYSISQADMKVFCYSMAEAKEPSRAVYAAELAARACRGDPLLCERLFANETELTEFPLDIIGGDGKQAHSAVWEAQITLCFPRLERARVELIEKYGSELTRLLPVQNGFGETVSDIFELEFADIVHLISVGRLRLPKEEYNDLCEYRRMRNALAHNKLLELADVVRLLE